MRLNQRRCAVVLILSIAVQASVSASPASVTLESEEKAGNARICEDDRASGKRCVGADVSGPSGTLWADTTPSDLPPGLYQCSFHLKFGPPQTTYLHGLRLTLVTDGTEHPLDVIRVADDYVAHTVAFVHTSRRPVSLAVQWVQDPARLKRAWGQERPAPEVQQMLAGEKPDAAEEGTDEDALEAGLPSVGRAYGALDRIVLTPVADTVIIERILPEKIHYTPGEFSYVELTLLNFTNTDQPVNVTSVLRWDLNRERPLGTQSVRVAAGERETLRVPLDVGGDEFGRECRATLTQGDRQLHSASACFGVSRNVATIGIQAHLPLKAPFPIGAGYAGLCVNPDEAATLGWQHTHGNWFEVFEWPPDCLNGLDPAQDFWFSGQYFWLVFKERLQSLVRAAHTRGVKVFTYAKVCASGATGWDAIREEPTWALGRTVGFYFSAHLSAEGLKRAYDLLDLRATFRETDKLRTWWRDHVEGDGEGGKPHPGFSESLWTDGGSPGLIRSHGEILARSIRSFGWDGVRYDHTFRFGQWRDDYTEEKDAGVIRYLKERTWQEKPHFVFGDNIGMPQSHPQITLWYKEVCRDGGLIMDEPIRNFRGRYVEWLKTVRDATVTARHYGGNFFPIVTVQDPIDILYASALSCAAGAHTYGLHLDPDCARFATRFSCLLWDMNLVPLPAPDQRIELEGPREIWWQVLAMERPVGRDQRQWILHLINPPSPEHAKMDGTASLPRPLSAVRVRVTPPTDTTVEAVWLLHPFPQVKGAVSEWWKPVGEEIRPAPGLRGTMRAEKLDCAMTGGRVEMMIPGLAIWNVVVFELRGGQHSEKPATCANVSLGRPSQAVAWAPSPWSTPREGRKLPTPEFDAPIAEETIIKKEFGKSGQTAPAPLELAQDGTLQVHLACGYYYSLWRIEEAIQRLGHVQLSQSFLSGRGAQWEEYRLQPPTAPRSQTTDSPKPELVEPPDQTAVGADMGTPELDVAGRTAAKTIAQFPERDVLRKLGLVILADIPAGALGPKGRAALYDFVHGGGSLFVLGGWWSLSRGQYGGTLLELITGVQVEHPWWAYEDRRGTIMYMGRPIEPAADHAISRNLKWDDSPCLMLYHSVRPRRDLEIVARIGDEPILLIGRLGTGKVATFAGTLMGKAPDGQVPFWKWRDWPVLLERTLRWLTLGRAPH